MSYFGPYRAVIWHQKIPGLKFHSAWMEQRDALEWKGDWCGRIDGMTGYIEEQNPLQIEISMLYGFRV